MMGSFLCYQVHFEALGGNDNEAVWANRIKKGVGIQAMVKNARNGRSAKVGLSKLPENAEVVSEHTLRVNTPHLTQRGDSMLKVGDKVRVLHSGAVGVIQELLPDNKVCVEFDKCVGSRTTFDDYLLEAIPIGEDMTGKIEVIHSDKGL